MGGVSEWDLFPRDGETGQHCAARVYLSDTPDALSNAVLNWVKETQSDRYPYSAKHPEKRRGISSTVRTVLGPATQALTAIIEHGYFDIDGRSEIAVAAQWQSTFGQPVTSERIHLFDGPFTCDDILEIIQRIEDDDLTARFRRSYLGYVVLRRDRFSVTCGRTMLPPPKHSERTVRPEQLGHRVRTLVDEQVSLFGIELVARGAPFIEQDGHVTVCAHAAAWMTHYTAVLRGLVPRRPIGKFHEIAAQHQSIAKQYPSPGLLDAQLFALLSEAGMPAFVEYVQDHDAPRETTVFSHSSLANGSPDWHRENITALVARYLNSGLPVIIGTTEEGRAHAKVICGYIRRSALKDSFQPTGDVDHQRSDAGFEDPVEAFVVHDDQLGPYQIEMVDALLAKCGDEDPVVVPLPPGISLRAEDAELIGAKCAQWIIRAVRSSRDAKGLAEAYALLEELLDRRQLALRTYVAESGDFKASFARRCPDRVATRVVALANLPRYVWVVEVVDRGMRAAKSDPVLGEIVFDASALNSESAEMLVAHMPGYIASLNRQEGTTIRVGCDIGVYESGRWRHTKSEPWSSRDLNRRVKTSGA